LVSVISPALGPTKFLERALQGNYHAANLTSDVKTSLITR